MTFHIITLFPDMFNSYLHESILERAQLDGVIKVKFYNPRSFVKNKWKQVDDKPYGGGPGMVIAAEPVVKAIAKAKGRKRKVKIIFLSPGGKQFDNKYAKEVAEDYKDIIFVCGRYEGIDARVKEVFTMDEVSIGPYVVTGGELPTMMMIDAIARQIPGVLGNVDSVEENRVASHDSYTRPAEFTYKRKKYKVPQVLLEGDHKKIEEWRSGKA